jgi:predicted nucleic acid-binding protein
VKVLLDTNIIVDDALEREPFWEAGEQILLLVEQGRLKVMFQLKLLVIYITSSVGEEVEIGLSII